LLFRARGWYGFLEIRWHWGYHDARWRIFSVPNENKPFWPDWNLEKAQESGSYEKSWSGMMGW